MQRLSLAILSILFFCLTVSSQSPVVWKTSVVMTDDTHGVFTAEAQLQDGWHMYGFEIDQGDPVPLSIDLSQSAGIAFQGQIKASIQPIVAYDEMFRLKLEWWVGNVAFSQEFKVVDKDLAIIVGTIKYMACDGVSCMPPKKENISLKINH